jgi:hypothetical protein
MLNSLCLNGGNLLCLPGGGDVKVLRSGDLGGGGREEDLDVTRVTLVRVAVESAMLLGVMALGDTLSPETVSPRISKYHSHSTVGSVSPPPGLGGLVDNNVSDNKLLDGEVLGVGVGLGVLDQSADESNRLLGPST